MGINTLINAIFHRKILEQYRLGNKGKKACPNGYKNITKPAICKRASSLLNIEYSEKDNDGQFNSVCFWSEGCDPKTARVANKFYHLASWICQKLPQKGISKNMK